MSVYLCVCFQCAFGRVFVDLKSDALDQQHAKAFHHLCVSNRSTPLTTELLLETHRILMAGCPKREDNVEVIPGQWRTGPISSCIHAPSPSLIPQLMEVLPHTSRL